ncbi:Ribosomal_S3_C domain-containing protein [Cephalotus follicularis]|uniref:Ribosomal_S3_C domain-containing protein n=1 Tax=Cephalotus follicularis TaxID=3775 RepID=A0A1Q3D6W7_CEPFO|nr:Ribosomal_S3_C domain-containing protein [Cephalotus follicularis]
MHPSFYCCFKYAILYCSRVYYGVLRFVMESGVKGCEVCNKADLILNTANFLSAKSMKFKEGYMISSGQPVNEYIDSVRHFLIVIQGVLGMKVKIMLDWDPKARRNYSTPRSSQG